MNLVPNRFSVKYLQTTMNSTWNHLILVKCILSLLFIVNLVYWKDSILIEFTADLFLLIHEEEISMSVNLHSMKSGALKFRRKFIYSFPLKCMKYKVEPSLCSPIQRELLTICGCHRFLCVWNWMVSICTRDLHPWCIDVQWVQIAVERGYSNNKTNKVRARKE